MTPVYTSSYLVWSQLLLYNIRNGVTKQIFILNNCVSTYKSNILYMCIFLKTLYINPNVKPFYSLTHYQVVIITVYGISYSYIKEIL